MAFNRRNLPFPRFSTNEMDADQKSQRRLWILLCFVEILGFASASCTSLLCAYCFELVRRPPIDDKSLSYRFLAAWMVNVLASIGLSWRLIRWHWIAQSSLRFWRFGPPGFMAVGFWSGLNIVIIPFGLHGGSSRHGTWNQLKILEVGM